MGNEYWINVYLVAGAHWIGGRCSSRKEADDLAVFTKPIYRIRVKPRQVLGSVVTVPKREPCVARKVIRFLGIPILMFYIAVAAVILLDQLFG